MIGAKRFLHDIKKWVIIACVSHRDTVLLVV
jgi:hypothetical protein